MQNEFAQNAMSIVSPNGYQNLDLDEIECLLDELEKEREKAIGDWDKREKTLRQELQKQLGSRFRRLSLPQTDLAEDAGLPLLPSETENVQHSGDISLLLERVPLANRYYSAEFIRIAKEVILSTKGSMPEFAVQYRERLMNAGNRMVATWTLDGEPSPNLIFALRHLCEEAYGERFSNYREGIWDIVGRETHRGKSDSGWYGIAMGPHPYSTLARCLTVMRRYQKKAEATAFHERNPRDWICFNNPTKKARKTVIELSDGIYSKEDTGLFQDEWLALVMRIAYVLAHDKLPPQRNMWFAIYRMLSRVGIAQLRSSLFGMQETTEAVNDLVLFPIEHPHIAKSYGAQAGSIMLAGPPGTGKTLAVHHLIMQDDHPVIFARITGDKLRRDLQGDNPSAVLGRVSKIRERTQLKVVLPVDDIESLFQDDELVNRFLELMNGMQEGGFLIIASTNNPEEINTRVFQPGRFDVLLHVGLPNYEERVGVLKVHLEGKPFNNEEEKDAIVQRIASQTEHWSQRLLWMVTRYAGLLGAKEAHQFNQQAPLEWRHFEKGIEFVRDTNNLHALHEWDAKIAQFVSHTRGRILSPQERLAHLQKEAKEAAVH